MPQAQQLLQVGVASVQQRHRRQQVQERLLFKARLVTPRQGPKVGNTMLSCDRLECYIIPTDRLDAVHVPIKPKVPDSCLTRAHSRIELPMAFSQLFNIAQLTSTHRTQQPTLLNSEPELLVEERRLPAALSKKDGDGLTHLVAEVVAEGHSVLVFCASGCYQLLQLFARQYLCCPCLRSARQYTTQGSAPWDCSAHPNQQCSVH